MNAHEKISALLEACRKKSVKIAIAESCTGGLLSAFFTDIPGSSDVFERGFVTYSNESKAEMLGVPAKLIEERGAVSREVAIFMAEGAIKKSHAAMAVSITGIAGPGGGSEAKPVGLVHMACAGKSVVTLHEKHIFEGNRQQVRNKAVIAATDLMMKVLESAKP